MKKYNRLIILGLLLGGSYQATAQYSPYYYSKHEVGVSVKAGVMKGYGDLPNQFSSDLKFNTAMGLQYDYFLHRKWSVGIGAQYAMQTVDYNASNLQGKYEQMDIENEKFIFSFEGKSYKEEWKVNQLTIPLTIQYIGEGETALYARTGVQLSLVMSSKSTLSWNQLKTEGYFPQYNLVLEGPTFAGFGSYDQVEYKPDLDLKDRWAWIAEVGVRHNLKENQQLYVGAYFDLGLNNQKPSVSQTKEQLIGYTTNPLEPLEYNSIQQSSKAVFKNYSVGIQLRYGLGL
ncbi:outer membrane beta-barrel protein [Myroides sp. 1354]|uniref:outer membrane beta-barrel protein n=1 Tax=unclassified Myroides TaxID=2642485 RepID=UPI002576E233|nr:MULTISPECIES: outer membrane beta-barrel protein [unclassified Myroides]MDM1044641.1 outer membrane beta-barrel protein [Myroides sp. R163-1]MDM1055354.1 outer membrane beta-barrel protein [Myroides sp. 1354]MDM1068651.1 outer membrane beta-barrel protein [Myroides sp. 1372]